MNNHLFAVLTLTAGMLGHTVNVRAEGSLKRAPKEYGVNRRVAVNYPTETNVLRFSGMTADIEMAVVIATSFKTSTITKAGQLPNKPSFYFGANGPGRWWNKKKTTAGKKPKGGWDPNPHVEVDAGLEYDSRPSNRGWRAFISVNGVQTNAPWRGKSATYSLNFKIDDDGIPHLKVTGGDATNVDFAWNHANAVSGERVFDTNSLDIVNFKRVFADTRPAPRSGHDADNYKLDGTRITCYAKECRIQFIWRGAEANYVNDAYLSPREPADTNQPSYFSINMRNTGYDTPVAGNDSYDSPDVNTAGKITGPTRQSRRIVDFPLLAPKVIPNQKKFPNIIDSGRSAGTETDTQASVSRYQEETARINLETGRKAKGHLHFIPVVGNTP